MIGYNGGLGVCFSIVGFLSVLLNLVTFLVEDGDASLKLALKRK